VIPNFVGQAQAAAPFILAAVGIAVFLLVMKRFGIPKGRR
jgi:hypothetical protein